MTTMINCEHCDYRNKYEEKRLAPIGSSGAWVCPACGICNTTYHKPIGFVTTLGYQRELEVGYL
jgi:hypothetical protein